MAQDPYKYFRVEARELTEQLGQGLIELERSGSGADVVPRLLRLAHTLKGAARVVRQPEIADLSHAIEDALGPFRTLAEVIPREHVDSILKLVDSIVERVVALEMPTVPAPATPAGMSQVRPERTAAEQVVELSPKAAAAKAAAGDDAARSMRTDVEEIDDLLDGITEAYGHVDALRENGAYIERARRLVDTLVEGLPARVGREASRSAAAADDLRVVLARLSRDVGGTFERAERELRQVRDTAEQLRLVPAAALFANLERVARDSAQILSKQVAVATRGGDVRLDGHVVRVVQDALIQMVRNAVAHGIELPKVRQAAGKPEEGRIVIEVFRRGRRVVFRCADDGAGLDIAALRDAAVRNGRAAAEVERLDIKGLVQVVMEGGISTASDVSAVAGRGIGMDIVRSVIARLDGSLDVTTNRGAGTTLELSVPLSLSSVEALIVEGSGVSATLPLDAVRHTLRLTPGDIHRSAGGESIVYDGRAAPLVSLGRLVAGQSASHRASRALSAVVVEGSTGYAAIGVDRLLGTANVVVRSLPELMRANASVGGTSLKADGSPLLMLDVEGLVKAALATRTASRTESRVNRPLMVVDDSLTTRMLEQSILESAGYRVDVATSAEEALERARGSDYALFLVDVEMPGMDGFGFIEEIRRDPALRDTPAILVTSLNAPEHRRRGEEVGAQGYVVKSDFDQTWLLGRIAELIA